MKNPMKLTIEDLARITSECEDMGVVFAWQIQPIVKNDKHKDEPERSQTNEKD